MYRISYITIDSVVMFSSCACKSYPPFPPGTTAIISQLTFYLTFYLWKCMRRWVRIDMKYVQKPCLSVCLCLNTTVKLLLISLSLSLFPSLPLSLLLALSPPPPPRRPLHLPPLSLLVSTPHPRVHTAKTRQQYNNITITQ